MDLAKKHCVPCEGGVPKLEPARVAELLSQLDGWAARDDKLHKRFTFGDFPAAIAFINRVAAVAEQEGHHPDFAVHYREVDVTIWTHAIGGLSENDFILAAKLDRVSG
jgi:4a-hydroxytetrahydrobiopterin dehydratase